MNINFGCFKISKNHLQSKILISLIFILISGSAAIKAQETLCAEPSVSGTTYSTIADGNWNDPAVWQGGIVPSFNIGSNNKVIILHTIDRNTGSDFFPSSNSVLVIKNGGALTTEQIQMESSAKIIINHGKLHVDHGNFQVKTSSASVCTYQACIIIDENFQFEESNISMTFRNTGIQINNGNLQSKANVNGNDIRIWLKNGNLERDGGTWPVNSISHRRVSGGISGFSGIVAQSSSTDIAANISPCNTNPVPITILDFEVVKKGNMAQLNYATLYEYNNKGFEIQRSTDSKVWQNIGFINSKADNGNSNTRLNYTYLDAAPLNGQNFYRLKQIDFDGSFEYSPTRSTWFSNEKTDIMVFPNPASENVYVSNLIGNEKVFVYDLLGNVVFEIKATQTTLNISFSNLSLGIYNIVIIDAKGLVSTHKIVKNN